LLTATAAAERAHVESLPEGDTETFACPAGVEGEEDWGTGVGVGEGGGGQAAVAPESVEGLETRPEAETEATESV